MKILWWYSVLLLLWSYIANMYEAVINQAPVSFVACVLFFPVIILIFKIRKMI